MAGLLPSVIRQPDPTARPQPDPEDVDLAETIIANAAEPNVVINFPDGSVEIHASGAPSKDLKDSKFDDNLAEVLGEGELSVIAEELLAGIEADEKSRDDWLQERAEGIKLLALKVEKPQSAGASNAAGVDNTSRSRHTLLLEAALRFQANARGELLPSDGPVKIESKMSRDTIEGDDLAQQLEDDMNYYLQETASEYYPDTDRMLLWVGVGGAGFKKVYRCPLRRRPVSESVPAEDLIVSDGATDLGNADRVTFVTRMRQSVMKRMQHLGVYRDVELQQPTAGIPTTLDEEKEAVAGVSASNRPEDIPYTIYECYCLIDVPGDEHKEDGEITGLPRPYKVTIDKSSRTILEIRRNWKEGDELEKARETFVKFPYVPGFGFYDLGLIHIAGNPATAATALLRIMIDSGIYGNFPGGLIAKANEKQNTTDLNVAPGSFAPVDTSMSQTGRIQDVVMPLPYKEFGPSIFQLYQDICTSGARVAGAADIAVGEGRQDAPVGTTIALIEQATKITDAVHKRLHTAQAKEFSLLRNLFRDYPEDFWRFNEGRDANWDKDKLLKALDDYNLVPRADPNTSSHMQRVMRAQAIYQMASADPPSFQKQQVYEYVMRAIGLHSPDQLLAPPAVGAPAPDPKAQAALLSAQADQTNAAAKLADVQLRAKNNDVENQNRDLDRDADLRIAAMKLKTEQVIHGTGLAADAASQASAQQHQQALAAGQQRADMVTAAAGARADHHQQMMGLVSDHAKQAKDHAHAERLASLKLPTPNPTQQP